MEFQTFNDLWSQDEMAHKCYGVRTLQHWRRRRHDANTNARVSSSRTDDGNIACSGNSRLRSAKLPQGIVGQAAPIPSLSSGDIPQPALFKHQVTGLAN
ncbi:Hypothetical protein NTJ_07183 [Nesidiocoris tenuis]|uniref:Uncharacterized protein n=1 Tax=Nesidiocoris tenuis TaxID=355587 RepID=A0ABN7AQ94_9HEMI|nr:Hypothetical protein NTJ_07183 [Nesidiocoris tenuis]